MERRGSSRGGTDLMIDLQHGSEAHPVPALVDITRIPELNQLDVTDGRCTLGAAVTHARIVKSPVLESGATCLVESCGVVGGPQVRNVGTLGGNVAHALPAADGTTSLIALDAEAQVAWRDGRREWLPLAALFKGAGVSALDHGRDLLVAFRFRLAGIREGSAFKRIMRPQGVALPILGCAVWVRLNQAGDHFHETRVCLAPVASTPVRAAEVEAALNGAPVSELTIDAAVVAGLASLSPRTSRYRATGEYRHLMIETLLRQALPLAVRRAQLGEAVAEGVGMG
ncbi:FAD binding domain-containing protein [Kamptonema cortianum]|nr:FAD binding domain-containing protein [Kamptonema cortianum]